jgi:hypothetical protein
MRIVASFRSTVFAPVFAALLFAGLPTGHALADTTTGSPEATSVALSPGADSPIHLFAAFEEAWTAQEADRLACLVDTTTVRIALKPGSPPTSAMTRSGVSFLFRDHLHLVKTTSFRIVRFEVSKKGKAQATASWTGDWGGRQGTREITVGLVAFQNGNRWQITEVRAND